MSTERRETSWTVKSAVRSPLLVLAGLTGLNAVVYWLFFVRPSSLPALYTQPLLDLRALSANAPMARWRLAAGFALLGLNYWLGWRTARKVQSRLAWVLVLGNAAISGAVLLFLYPFGAADLFDNIMHGRILSVYGANPFDQVASEFRSDVFYSYVGWRHFASAYGPAWELFAAGTAWLAGDGVVSNVLAFKALGGLFLVGCIAIVTDLLRRTAPQRALAGTLLLAWNPVILYETLGQGHNDVAVLFFVLSCAWCLATGRNILATATLVMGTLVKFVPVLLLPAAGMISLRALPGNRERLRFAAMASSVAALLIVLAYAPFWHGTETLGIGRRRGLFTTSLPAVLHAVLQEPLGTERSASLVSLVAATATTIFALWQGARASREPSWSSFVQAAFTVLMFYLLCTCLWFQQWYLVWPLGLVPLLPTGRQVWLGLSVGFAVLSKPFLFEPLWLWTDSNVDRSWLELRLGPAVLALPWALTLVALWKGWQERHLPEGWCSARKATGQNGVSDPNVDCADQMRPPHSEV